MKAGDTFRLGGIPIVVVSDADYPHDAACKVCAFREACAHDETWAHVVETIEEWRGGSCFEGHHYEVRA